MFLCNKLMGVTAKVTAPNLCQIRTGVGGQNDARATQVHQLNLYPLFLRHSPRKTWLVFKLQKDMAVFTAADPPPLICRSSRIYFLCKQSSQSQRGARWLSWELPFLVLTPSTELCCHVCSLQCCCRLRQSQSVWGGSGGDVAFLFLWYLSSDFLTSDLIKKTWEREDNIFLMGAFLHNNCFLLLPNVTRAPVSLQYKSLSSLKLLLEPEWWLQNFGHTGSSEGRQGLCHWVALWWASFSQCRSSDNFLVHWLFGWVMSVMFCGAAGLSLKNRGYRSWKNQWQEAPQI